MSTVNGPCQNLSYKIKVSHVFTPDTVLCCMGQLVGKVPQLPGKQLASKKVQSTCVGVVQVVVVQVTGSL